MHAIGMFLGFLLELLPRTEINENYPIKMSTLRNFTYILGCVSIVTPWLVIFCYFFKIMTRPHADPPDFVYVAFFGTFIMFSLFGINSFLCHNLKLYDFHRAEYIYIILSFTAKTLLAGDVYGGLAAQSDDDYNN
jgi:drug/metabolite transporter (DMT)-like permease